MVYEERDSHVEPTNCPDYIGRAGKIVWDLVSPLFGKGCHLYVDNLHEHSRLRLGERACLKCNNLLAMKWRDNKNVFVLSSLHADMTVQIPTPTAVVEKPLCINENNQNMGWVDLNDQLLAPYLIARKARRWYIYTAPLGKHFITPNLGVVRCFETKQKEGDQ
ncbi:hypothetical protein AB205_0209610 [Aquarana catesbeiana]|uniref:PiggyBac transposable element-derived protein domain-containing protein n=1 Tax=Aquarana catesbeiana TaxID=8400 RepID=A0A2G9QEM4_AQUCT|nr:hypothetical protein AB205_0209610 [Aquarana catesbeiana]